ncbi:MAG: PilZ domain-containing protein [Magnetococcales bacterium]|nr:PilZ domain-containing protein [Magnetococcales bacterium]
MHNSSASDFSSKRNSQRLEFGESAVMRYHLQDIPIKVLDMGITGFGIHTEMAVPVGSLVEIEISDDSGLDIYQCLCVFCNQDGTFFHIGLEIKEQESELAFLPLENE